MASINGMNSAGTYVVTTGYGKDSTKTEVKADYLDYGGPDGCLQAYQDGAVIATFKYWESIVKKKD